MPSHRINADYNQISKDAGDEVRWWLAAAKRAITEEFGDGYAAAHPELVAAFLHAAATARAGVDLVIAAQIAHPEAESS